MKGGSAFACCSTAYLRFLTSSQLLEIFFYEQNYEQCGGETNDEE